MANRVRQNEVHVYLTDDEKRILDTKFTQSGMKSRSAFLRHQILYGYVYDADYSNLHEYNMELSKIGVNINQIAKRINQTGSIYQEDLLEIKNRLDEIWHTQKSMLSKQPYIKQ